MVQYHVCSLPFRSVTALVPFLCALCLFLFLFKEVPCEGSPLASSACPCDNASLCEPVTAVYRRELFGWGSARWRDYDLDRVTTIAGADPEDSDLVCEAHRKGVRLVYWIPNHELPFEASTEGKMEYARDLASRIEEWHFDGAAFDFEDPVGWQSELSTNYTEIVRLASEEMKRRSPNRQISVAAAWSPHGIDGRYFDYLGLAEASDLLYVMAYDIQSQVFGRCIGDANSPIAFAEWGLRSFLSIGVEASKLVLGVPWYGYIYGCTEASAPVSLGQEKGEGDSGRGLQSGHQDMEAEEGKGGGGDSQLGSDADSQTASAGVAVSGQTVRTAGLTESALDSDICWMGFAPFRGVRCSDLWGRQVS
uniref:GH18 domain-containing protein n=1 Tax=Chromera velia CCMP2878 TaxID=1169474 RepID=A0A0G4HYE2_9ALVE|eukprot:Cvel_9485.t1-p1 / transcript=Cvel_9485.t1 / gene=Cvel_9485 / organism=Chromera_velia_CCMP2878 / gene_product=Di-N-acetylchitobiase, putative / transcript_product=Di-N-acetylchitobiase, putative / location=Cvel_scaffold548:513-1601(-) / protein_length=363 / sequence_SO=supercontig / SO=protein_coding / is_pseudo=false